MAHAMALCAIAWGHAQYPLSVDTTFRTSIAERYVGDIHFMDDGSLLVTGLVKLEGEIETNSMGLLNPSGEALWFIGGSTGTGDIIPFQDKYFIQGGQYFLRFNSDFTVDYTYDNQNLFIDPWNGGDIHVQPDGRVLTTGSHVLRSYEDTSIIGYNFCLVRLDTVGYPDSTFTHCQCQTGYATRIFEMDDGRFILSGTMAGYDGQAVGRILRVWPDGSLDTTFHTSIYNGAAHDIWAYPDGRLLAAGIFSLPEYPNDTLHLIRLLPNGDIDTTFPNTIDFRWPEIYFPSTVTINGIFELLPDVLVLTGVFTHVEGMDVGGLIAIDTAGNLLHGQYFTGTGCDTVIFGPNEAYRGLNRMVQAPDGSYYIYGTYRGFDDGYALWEDQPFITRLHPLNVGIEGHAMERGSMTLFPVPGSDHFTITLPHVMPGDLIQVANAQGSIVWSATITAPEFRVDASSWRAGLYCVKRLNSKEEYSTAKWLKQ